MNETSLVRTVLYLILDLTRMLLCCATAEAVALGFQHYLVMLGSSIMIPSILVPMMGGSDVSSELCTLSCNFYQFCCDIHYFSGHCSMRA